MPACRVCGEKFESVRNKSGQNLSGFDLLKDHFFLCHEEEYKALESMLKEHYTTKYGHLNE